MKGLQKILGFMNYLSKSITLYSQRISPLQQWLNESHEIPKTKLLDITKEITETFQAITKTVPQNTSLFCANNVHPFVTLTDASDYAIGGLLTEFTENTNDPNELAVAYVQALQISYPSLATCTD
jgi:hypothetical protein